MLVKACAAADRHEAAPYDVASASGPSGSAPPMSHSTWVDRVAWRRLRRHVRRNSTCPRKRGHATQRVRSGRM